MNNNITVRGEFRIELSQLQFEEIVSFLKEKNIKFDVCLQPEITLMENSKDYELKSHRAYLWVKTESYAR